MKNNISQDTEGVQSHKLCELCGSEVLQNKNIGTSTQIFLTASGIDMLLPCFNGVSHHCRCWQAPGQTARGSHQAIASRVAAEMWGGKTGNDGKGKNEHRRLEINNIRFKQFGGRKSRVISNRGNLR